MFAARVFRCWDTSHRICHRWLKGQCGPGRSGYSACAFVFCRNCFCSTTKPMAKETAAFLQYTTSRESNGASIQPLSFTRTRTRMLCFGAMHGIQSLILRRFVSECCHLILQEFLRLILSIAGVRRLHARVSPAQYTARVIRICRK